MGERALRSIKPEAGKTGRDRNARQAKRKEILNDIEIHKSPPSRGVFPNFGPDPNLHYEDYMVVKVRKDRLIKLGKKLVRGITYHIEKRFIEDNEEIGVFFVHDEAAADIISQVKKREQCFHQGPGINVSRVVATDNSRAAIFAIEIWGRLKIYASLIPKDRKAAK